MRQSIVIGAKVFAGLLLICSPAAAQKKASIVLGNNPLYDAKDGKSSPCSATTIAAAFLAKRGEAVDWWVKDGDTGNEIGKCTNADKFDTARVTLEFDKPSPIGPQSNKGGHITATVLDKTAIAEGAYYYRVLYDGKKAQDPELDVKGDMPPVPTPKKK